MSHSFTRPVKVVEARRAARWGNQASTEPLNVEICAIFFRAGRSGSGHGLLRVIRQTTPGAGGRRP